MEALTRCERAVPTAEELHREEVPMTRWIEASVKTRFTETAPSMVFEKAVHMVGKPHLGELPLIMRTAAQMGAPMDSGKVAVTAERDLLGEAPSIIPVADAMSMESAARLITAVVVNLRIILVDTLGTIDNTVDPRNIDPSSVMEALVACWQKIQEIQTR